MTKRMTAEEVADKIMRLRDDQVVRDQCWLHHNAAYVSFAIADGLVRENLVPQWQDEAVEGPCWVRGVDSVCSVYHWHDDEQPGDGGWSIEYIVTRDDGTSEMRWEPLNGRQVCPIGARPQ